MTNILIITTLFANLNGVSQHPKFDSIQRIIEAATDNNLTGVAVYIKSPKLGEWIGVSGYSNLEEGKELQAQDVFGLASIGKTYTAVAVMKLVEEGRLNLEDKISQYLPDEIIQNAPDAEKVTIRHLLSHTSGFSNYEADPELNELYLSGQLKLDTVSHVQILRRFFYGTPASNEPGERFKYSSTNYLLLTMIMDAILEEGHEEYIRGILRQNGLARTWYKETPEDLIEHYGDLDQDGVSENLTSRTIETTNWFSGDDGFYASVDDAANFLEDLVNFEILSERSVREMTTWNNAKKPDYGLGLEAHKSFPYGLIYGHSGSGIAVRTDLYYFPKKDMIVGIFCNSGLRAASGSFAQTYYKMRKNIIFKLFLI